MKKKKNICLHNFQFSGCWLSPPTEAVGPKTIEKREPSFLCEIFRLINEMGRFAELKNQQEHPTYSSSIVGSVHFFTTIFPTWARCCREYNAARDFTWLYIRNNKTRNIYEAQPKHTIRLS